MAKYAINHTCGHAQQHELFGPGKQRQQKINWLETTKCKDCWSTDQRAARAAKPITAELIYNAYSGGAWLAVTGGDSYPIKDALKAAGCQWGEYYSNNDILGLSKPRRAWMIKIDDRDETDIADKIQRLYGAGVTRVIDTTNPLSGAIAARLEQSQEVKS